MREMLSTLVREANFLVEDNLNILVEDEEEFNEGEKTLFKLDSILTAIGVEGEEEVMNVLKKHEASQQSDIDGVRESIMKIIRTHIEQNRRRMSGAGDMVLHKDKQARRMDKITKEAVKPGMIRLLRIMFIILFNCFMSANSFTICFSYYFHSPNVRYRR